jgi:hypothetical protein
MVCKRRKMRTGILFIMFVYAITFLGCSTKANNLLDYIAVTQTQKATAENKKIGKIASNAPIMKEPDPIPAKEKILKNQTPQYKSEIEMVGYIVRVQKDEEVELYVYTFTDALKTKKIHFFYPQKLPYKSSQLVRVIVQDNFLKEHKSYTTNKANKKTFNSYIESAKELFIETK